MSLYQALTNLSLPRKGDPRQETDLIFAGETVDLDDDQAALFLPPLRQPPVIRKAAEASTAMPVLLPRQLSGVAINRRTLKPIGWPGPPVDARPDPPGSSEVQVMQPPEATEPQPLDETAAPGAPQQDAVDIAPRRNRRTVPAVPAPAGKGA